MAIIVYNIHTIHFFVAIHFRCIDLTKKPYRKRASVTFFSIFQIILQAIFTPQSGPFCFRCHLKKFAPGGDRTEKYRVTNFRQKIMFTAISKFYTKVPDPDFAKNRKSGSFPTMIF